jgi:hypothetical protein
VTSGPGESNPPVERERAADEGMAPIINNTGDDDEGGDDADAPTG